MSFSIDWFYERINELEKYGAERLCDMSDPIAQEYAGLMDELRWIESEAEQEQTPDNGKDEDDVRNKIVERIEELEQNQSERLGDPKDEIAVEYAGLVEELSRYDSGIEQEQDLDDPPLDVPDEHEQPQQADEKTKDNADLVLKPENALDSDHAPRGSPGSIQKPSAPGFGGSFIDTATTYRSVVEDEKQRHPQNHPKFRSDQGRLKQEFTDKVDRSPQGQPDVVLDRDPTVKNEAKKIDDDFLKEKAKGLAKKNFNKVKGIDI